MVSSAAFSVGLRARIGRGAMSRPVTDALFAPPTTSRTAQTRHAEHGPRHVRWIALPLFWRLLGVNLVVVLGGALIGTWLTQRLVLSGTFTPLTHALLVLAALCLSAGLTMLLLRETFRPIHSLRDATRRFNAGDHSARAVLAPMTDPDVAGLVLDVNALWDRLEADAATIREKTEQAERLAAQVIMAQEDERRRVDDLGLVAALRQYARSTEERSGLTVGLTVMGWDELLDARLPAEVETALFRIAQEALTNAIRHAHAATVHLRLRRSPAAVTLEVRDDGVGIGASPTSEGEHLGMFGMRERARLLGGEFNTAPVSPRGTLVRVSIPL